MISTMTAWAQVSSEINIGVVSSEIIVQGYPQFRQAEQQLAREVEGWRSERAAWEADMERLQNDIVEKEERLRAGQNTFSEQKKATMQTTIDSLRTDFSERMNSQMAAEQERLNRRRAELLGEVFEEVNEVINEVGEQSDFDLIIDITNGTIIYAKDPEDITDSILRKLQDK